MTDKLEQLNNQIASLEARIADQGQKLKVAQDRWEDWKAGQLRAAIGQDQIALHNLRIERSSLEPTQEKKASAIFYSSNS
jgi:hypothetical protein